MCHGYNRPSCIRAAKPPRGRTSVQCLAYIALLFAAARIGFRECRFRTRFQQHVVRQAQPAGRQRNVVNAVRCARQDAGLDTEWFKRDTLRLKHLVNIAAQADPKALPPEKGPWVNIIADLDYHIRLRHLKGVPNPSGIKRRTRVAVEPLWNFLIGPNYVHLSRWGPIREVCRQWAAVRGIVLREPRQSGQATVEAETRCAAWLIDLMADNSKPEKKRDDYHAEGEFSKISKRAFGRAWGHAITTTKNTNWNKAGPKPNSPR